MEFCVTVLCDPKEFFRTSVVFPILFNPTSADLSIIVCENTGSSCRESHLILSCFMQSGPGGGKQTETLEEIICSAILTKGLQGRLKYVFLSITAFLGNALILVALRKESSLYPPSKLLFRFLATNDLCVGLISETIHVISIISVAHDKLNRCRYALFTMLIASYILRSVTLLTVTAISVEKPIFH